MVANRLQRNLHFLKTLKKAKKRQRTFLLKSASDDCVLCICDCANNVLRGNVRLKPKDKKALRRYKKALRALTQQRSAIKTKRKLLIQKGGFLLFLAPILSAAGGFLGGLFRGNSNN